MQETKEGASRLAGVMTYSLYDAIALYYLISDQSGQLVHDWQQLKKRISGKLLDRCE